MSWRGEQGEHLSRFRVLSQRVLAKDLRSALMLTLLTPASRATRRDHQRGGLA
jgi:hypothetical protein